jgi:hypothetical protein
MLVEYLAFREFQVAEAHNAQTPLTWLGAFDPTSS